MKKIFNPFLMIVMALSPACFTAVGAANAKDIRKPVYAGSFYPDTPEELTAIIKQLVNQVKPIHVNRPPHSSLKALIIPHAGYRYSGWTAAHISLVLKENQFKKVIVTGPDHRIGFQGDDFGRDGAADQRTDFAGDLDNVASRFQDQRRVRGDTIHHAKIVQFGNGLNISGIHKEFHRALVLDPDRGCGGCGPVLAQDGGWRKVGVSRGG